MNTAILSYLGSPAEETAELMRSSLQQTPYRDTKSLQVLVEGNSVVVCGNLDSFYHRQIVQNRLAFAYRSLEVVDQITVSKR